MPRWTKTPAERFFGRICPHPVTGCWNWLGCVGDGGYGFFSVDGRGWGAHRFAYTMFVGEVPEGLQIDHLCRNRRCCNPDHLEAVTPRENVRRGIQRNSKKTRCPAGHPYDGIEKRGVRFCRECKKAGVRRRYAENPEYRERRLAANAQWASDPANRPTINAAARLRYARKG